MADQPVIEDLRAIWEDILDIEVTDIDADFFDLGGDSLTAVVVANQAIEIGINLRRTAVLRHPTLRRLAEEVRLTCRAHPPSGEEADDST